MDKYRHNINIYIGDVESDNRYRISERERVSDASQFMVTSQRLPMIRPIVASSINYIHVQTLPKIDAEYHIRTESPQAVIFSQSTKEEKK
jgi:hypothetical protein